jgi:serine/threonine protein kinase/tetratricopeptide (TPR) repeat protein
MEFGPPIDPSSSILKEPERCRECNSDSRLTNGLCLNCLLLGAVDDTFALETEAFGEALASVRRQDGGCFIGDHEIIAEIGRGGMGVIYRAREPHSGRIVALKCILPHQGDSDQVLARFRREAETAARLDHPNIVPIYHVGETADGSPFFTMKYATNGSLLQARGRLRQEPRQSVLLVAKVAAAVQYAHEQGVLHRDLKPGNILLDGRAEPLVSDFGLARCEKISSHLTRSFTSFGTPGYIAPEQTDGPAVHLTSAADIYSLGAILFDLLTGRPPFLGDNAFGVMKRSLERPAPKLRTVAPHLDRDLETICARCLERDPRARYQSAGALAQDLLSWLDSRSIIARPIGVWLRFRHWIRNNHGLAALLAAFFFLAVVSMAWQIRSRELQAVMHESILASRSIVVLPSLDLDNVKTDPVTAQLLVHSLQTQLTTLGPVRVVIAGLASSADWGGPDDLRRVGQASNARAVLTSTVRTNQGKTRVSFRLVDTASGDLLFTHLSKENERVDLAKFITEDMSRVLYAILSAQNWSITLQARLDPGLRNDVAREAITAGRLITLASAPDCDKAIALFRKALQAEPNSSLAHSYIAMASAGRLHHSADRSFIDLGKEEAGKAIQLSPNSSDAHRAMAGVYYQEGKYSEALEEQFRTIEIGGLEHRVGCFIGLTLNTLGRPHQALKWYGLVSRLAGAPGDVDAVMGDCWARLGDDEQAFKAYDRAAELRPDSLQGLLGISHIRLLGGNFEDARKICQVAGDNRNDLDDSDRLAAQIEFFARNFGVAEQLYSKLEVSDVDGGGSYYGAITYQSALGRIKQAVGDSKGANAILKDNLTKEAVALADEPENSEAAYRLAAVEASLGLLDASFRHLHEAVALGWIDYRSLKLDPRFDSLRSKPELQTIVEEVSAKVASMRATMCSNN